MAKKFGSLVLVAIVLSMLTPQCIAKDTTAQILKQQERYTLSLELEFGRKDSNGMPRVFSFLNVGTNGYATGFLVGDGLVMTAYHVVSGEIGNTKKLQLGFSPDDQLEVKIFVNGCQATVIKVDQDADLALLRICGSQKQTRTPAFQPSLSKDEQLLLIARPHGDKMVRRGTLYGSYSLRGQQYWFVKIDGRDGYSGSPVYNQKAEVVGVFSGYDWSQKLALVSPATRAQKLLEDYISNPNP
jgi:S1-C subfamily serine protease